MSVLLNVVAIVFVVMGLGLLSAYMASRNVGLLLAGAAYGGAGVLAIAWGSWWVLIVGFGLALVLRFLGLDPSVE